MLLLTPFVPIRAALGLWSVAIGLVAITGCGSPPSEAQTQPNATGRAAGDNAPVSVETAIATTGTLETTIEYTGTTTPVRTVSLRSQAEGRLLSLNFDVGDRISQGQTVGEVDNRLLLAAVNQERAELAALESEVAQAESEVSTARAQVEQARVELQQAQSDAARLQSLATQGAITEQEAERAVTAVRTAEQVLRSAQEQVRTQQQSVIANQRRVTAQQATLAEVQTREAFSVLTAPIAGAVLTKTAEPGDLVQPGDEVLQLGDFSRIKVTVQVSELQLGALRLGQAAQVKLDAFPNQVLSGQISRISPAADPTARLIPVEITLPNPGEQFGSGLLARVQFQTGQSQQVIVPESAFVDPEQPATLFVVQGEGEQSKAVARSVQVGEKRNGQVEIRSGLRSGESFIVRSSGPLKDGQAIQLSILSKTAPANQGQAN